MPNLYLLQPAAHSVPIAFLTHDILGEVQSKSINNFSYIKMFLTLI